jgi:hypothetical protein
MRAVVLLLCGTVAGAGAGCALGEGKGAVDGAIFIRQCAPHTSVGASAGVGTAYSYGESGAPLAYDMNPTFFAAEPIDDFSRLQPNNRLNIRVQSDGSRIEQADVLFINIASVHEVALALGQDIAVDVNTNVRATLSLSQSCPSPEVTPSLAGTINFTAFGDADQARIPPDFRVGFEDHLQATFNFRVVDTRAATIGGIGNVPVDPAVGGDITGYFDFVVRQGQRAQAYP